MHVELINNAEQELADMKSVSYKKRAKYARYFTGLARELLNATGTL